MLTVERISDISSWLDLDESWDRLVHVCPDATTFQTFPWLFSWWEAFGEGALLVLIARDEKSHIVGIAPLSVRRQGLFWLVQLLGEGVSDYLNLIVHPARAQECVDVFIEYLRANYSRFVLRMFDIPPFALLRDLDIPLASVARPGFPCPTVALPPTWDEYLALLSRKKKREMKKIWNQLGGDVAIEPIEAFAFSEALLHLFRLHEKWWQSRGESGVLAQAKVQKFHGNFVRRTGESGLIRMYSVEVSGEIIAIWYGFSIGSRVFFYISGMDPKYQRQSPGSALMGRAIQGAIEESATHFDMLRGAEPYKVDWCAETGRPNTHFVFFSGLAAKALFAVYYLASKVAVRLRR